MLTLPQASKLTGKHEDTIRRLIKRLLETDPAAKDKITQEKTVRGFYYLIDAEYLMTNLQPLQTNNLQPLQIKNKLNHKTASNQPLNNVANQLYVELKAKDETIAILKKQLEQKDQQISQLLERHRETNILLKGYQDKYLLAAPKGQHAGQKSKPKKVEQPKKKGFFSWFS